MELREIELTLQKLQRVGTGYCEACNQQVRFSEIDIYNGLFLCPACIRKMAWEPEETLELPS